MKVRRPDGTIWDPGAKREAERREAAKIDLPDIMGWSEAQVSWAIDCREAFISENGTVKPQIREILLTQRDARWWIDHHQGTLRDVKRRRAGYG